MQVKGDAYTLVGNCDKTGIFNH